MSYRKGEHILKKNEIVSLFSSQKAFFISGGTLDADYRIRMLQKLKKVINENQKSILAALYTDMRKPETEAYISEIYLVQMEIDIALKNIKKWTAPRKVSTPAVLFKSTSWLYPEPYGVALIISPWNYPFQLLIDPLVGAIAAGNCAILKPSELAPATSSIISQIISDTFDPSYIAVVEGGIEESTALLSLEFDYFFYTGSTSVGRVIMKAAAENLIPVTLELGGKSPCIVDKDADLIVAARRIVKGKFFNAGQTCIAPDYLYVHRDVRADLTDIMKNMINEFYGSDPSVSPAYARIINDRHFARLSGLMKGDYITGGITKKEERYIAPTIIGGAAWSDPIMHEEIFGPLLPVLVFENIDDVIREINARPKPLALYYFSRDKKQQEKILTRTSSGGVCINDTIEHIVSEYLPFGGVGASGMGSYHGRASFDTFTHTKGVLKKSFYFDVKMKYAPYRLAFKTLKKLLALIS